MTLTNTIAKAAAAIVAASLVVGVAFVAVAPRAEAAALSAAQISSIVSLLQSFGADATTVANVTASLNGTTPSVPSTPSTPSACGFTRDLTLGAKGADVTCLQQALIAKGYSVPAGATGFFGAQTQAAVIAWQKAAGVTPAAGYFGAKSRAAFGGTTSTGPGPVTPAGTGLTVSAGPSIANSLAPAGASRVPFTKVTLTAGNDGDVVVNSVQVQRTGFGQDAAFAGIVLIDDASGLQLGTPKTFNSNHQTAIGQVMTIPRGTSKTFTVAANMNSPLTNYAGEAPAISVVGVNTSATVTGSLPITGAYHTINATLTVGSVSLDVSNAFASNTNTTKEIGTTGYKFSGFRLTAGSSEDVRLKSITFNQTGSVSSSDLANVMVYVGSTAYPTVISTDGRYYTATLGSGVVIAKGNQVEVYLTADIVGSNVSGRTVTFDVDKTTDIYGTGETYGYGVSPSTSGGVAVSTLTRGTSNTTETTGTPYIFASVVTLQGASVSSIAKANEVPAQNIAINLSNQPLGGYVVDIKGENMTVASTVVTFATSTASLNATSPLTNLTIVDENGAVVAGPVDPTCGSTCSATFTDTITYKTGRHIYTVRGKVASGASNGAIITATTASTGWTTVRGELTGNTISLPTFTAAMNPMTVKAGSLVIGVSSSLSSQSLVPGGQGVELGRFTFDAGQSGEDVRFSTIPADLVYGGSNDETELTSCQIFDGATALNTGSNTVNPSESGSSPIDVTFTLDNSITVAKGTVKTLSVKCNVSGSATNNGTFAWAPGTTGSFIGGFSSNVTGAVSGTTISPTAGSGSAPTFTIGTGSLTATASTASIAQPSRAPAAGGTSGVTVGYVKFRATNEAVNLTKVGLTLANGLYGSLSTGQGGSSQSGAGDVVTAYIYNGATQVGMATFNGTQTATSTFSSAVSIPRDTDVLLTIKADLANVGVSSSGGIGDLVKIDPLNAEGTGASSGSVVAITATAGVNGVQLVKSYPTVALGSGACTGNNCNGSNQILKVFTVTANASGSVGVYQSKIVVATSSASLFDAKLFVYDQSGQPVSSQGSGSGQIGSTACATGTGCTSSSPTLTFTASTPVQIPAGTTYTFKLLGTVTPGSSATNWSVISTVQGDSAVQTGLGSSPTYIATSTSKVATSNFVWSDNATSTAAITDVDWFNGFQIPGLSGTGI